MTTLDLSQRASAPALAAARPLASRPVLGPWALLVVALIGGLALGWQGGWLGLVGAACAITAGLGLPWLRRQSGPAADHADPQADPAGEPLVGGRVGAEVMVSQVVPVWSKQLDITRETASQGLGQLQAGIRDIAAALACLTCQLERLAPSAEAGHVDGMLAGAADALALLLAPSQDALQQRDAAWAELARCAQALDELRQAGQDAREIGKHTRLVAFNASIEAQRNGSAAANGAVAIAMETRALAGRMAEVGDLVGRTVTRLGQTLQPCQLRAQMHDTTPEELRLSLDLRAREALGRLQTALGGVLNDAAEVEATCKGLRQSVDGLVGQLQLGDRLTQMLQLVGHDMGEFARWVQRHPYATQSDAADWLAKLEASYTMEEQRARHHGNLHIERAAKVDLF